MKVIQGPKNFKASNELLPGRIYRLQGEGGDTCLKIGEILIGCENEHDGPLSLLDPETGFLYEPTPEFLRACDLALVPSSETITIHNP